MIKVGAIMKYIKLIFYNHMIICFSVFFMVCFSMSNIAVADVYNITVKLSIREKNCDIYGVDGKGLPIHVDFETININGFNSDNYEKQIMYQIDCGDSFLSNESLKMRFISETVMINNEELIKTSTENLGLKLFSDNKTVLPNQYINFLYGNKPKLTIKPVINENADIKLGEFLASGTLSIEYD